MELVELPRKHRLGAASGPDTDTYTSKRSKSQVSSLSSVEV